MDLLNRAQEVIQGESLGLTEPLKRALSTRIEFRAHLLAAVDIDQMIDKERAGDWAVCIELLSSLKETYEVGKPVESSFSIKMQRKLASTVPPRPIVDVKFDDAWDLLNRLCQSGKDAYRILEYHGGSQLQVCSTNGCLNIRDQCLTIKAELCMVLPIANASTTSVHPMPASIADLQ